MDFDAIQPGTTLAREPLTISRERAALYRDAVGDRSALYDEAGVAPAMAVAALAMDSAMRAVELPSGAIHVSQQLAFMQPLALERPTTCTTTMSQNSVRRGVRFLVLQFEVASDGGAPVMTGSATITIKEADT